MIYLIGGVPRAGKSTLAQKIVERKQIPFVPGDALLWMLIDALPEKKIRETYEGVPDRFFPFLKEFVKHTSTTVPDYVIEGDCFDPRDIKELSKRYEIKSCFLGLSQTTLEIIKEHNGHNDWLHELSPEDLAGLPKWISDRSQIIKNGCQEYGIEYFDMSDGDYNQNLEKAYGYLFDA